MACPQAVLWIYEMASSLWSVIVAIIFCPLLVAFAQEITPTPETAFQPVATTVEVIVTGSNIPTAEEVGPQPVDTYRRVDLERLGARSVTDFVQKLPVATGPSINENVNTIGDGRTDIDLRGLGAKETLVLQDGRRLAPDGFAGYYNDLNAFFGGTVDLNLFPFGLIDHIDILKDGASAIYGSDAVGGVFNVWLIHRFRGLEIYASYGNTNLGASNDQGEERAYLLAGTGDDKTDIVVYAEVYNRAAIYDRDRDISSNADFTRFGGPDNRLGDFAGRVGDFVYQPGLNRGAGSPRRHAFPDVANDPQYGRSPVFRGRNSSLTTPLSHRQWPQSTVNTSTARSTTKYAINIWSSLPTLSTCAVSGMASWRQLHFLTSC